MQQTIDAKPLPVFSDEVIDFLDYVSKALLKNPETRNYPDVVTFGFWCRKASLLKLRDQQKPDEMRIGLGLAFHISPSNVPVNFAYSLAVGLLAGNANIVRVPSKTFIQVELISEALRSAAEKFPLVSPYIRIVRYGHDKTVTDEYSALCDLRIIWGGDDTIRTIRQSPLKPRAQEITFADRYSIAVIDAEKYLEEENKNRIANDFFNDTYLTDQNACTSPKLVAWLGKDESRSEEAQTIFWDKLAVVIGDKYEIQPAQVVQKWVALCELGAAGMPAHLQEVTDTSLMRISVENLSCETMDYAFNSGFFLEYFTNDLDSLLPVCGKSCQTIGYFGCKEEIRTFIEKNRPAGVDRVVPIGKTMDFSLIWDGYDLIRAMSRRIEIG